MSLFRILSYLKLPKIRIITNLILENIKRAIEEPNIMIYKYINIKPIFLLLMKKFFNVNLKDIAPFFSAKAKVLVNTSSGIADEQTVLISRIYKTRIEAVKRNKETGRYCYICGTEYLRTDDIPLKATTPCKKCQKNIEAIGEQIEGLLPFSIKKLLPKVPKGFLMRGFVIDGKIFYPYKNKETLNKYIKLQENPEWKLEDVKLSIDPVTNMTVIDGAYFRKRKVLQLKSFYNNKDFRKKTHIKVLENYLQYLETGKYNKPKLKDNNQEYPEETEGTQIILGNTQFPSKLTIRLNFKKNDNYTIPFESNSNHLSYSSYENSLYTIDKAQKNFATLDLISNTAFNFSNNAFITDLWIYTTILGKQELLLSLRNMDDKNNKLEQNNLEKFTFIDFSKIPIGVFGFTIIYFMSYRQKQNPEDEGSVLFYKDFVYKRHINIIDSRLDNYSIPTIFECSDENFLRKINNKIFNTIIPLNKVKFKFLGTTIEKAKINVILNNRILKELIFNYSTFISPELSIENTETTIIEYENETFNNSIQNSWNEIYLDSIDINTFNTLMITNPFDINILRLEFYDNNNTCYNKQEVFFRFVNDISAYSDNISIIASIFKPKHDYNNLKAYTFSNIITAINKRRSFYLKYILIDLYTTPFTEFSTIKYRQIIDISSYSYDWGNMNFSYAVTLPIELNVWNNDYINGRLDAGEYYVKMTAVIQYPENFQEELDITKFKLETVIEDNTFELNKYYLVPIKIKISESNQLIDGTIIKVDNDDPYSNAESEGFSIVNMVLNKEDFKNMCEKLAYKIGSVDIDAYFKEFTDALPQIINDIENPYILQPRIVKTIEEPEFSKLKLYDKDNIVPAKTELPNEVNLFGKSAILQFVYTNKHPNLDKVSETDNETISFKDEMEKYHLYNDMKDFITETEKFSYISWALEEYGFYDTLGSPGNHYLFNTFIGRNLAKTPYKLGEKVFFLQSIGGKESPVKSIHKGIIEEIYFNLPKNIKFNEIEYILFKESNNIQVDIIGSAIPMLGENNPPELPMDIQRQYKIRADSLFLTYEDAKKNALWVLCVFCMKFKKPLPKDKNLRDLLEFTEYIATGEVDNYSSEIPSKLSNIQDLRKFSEEVIKKATFNTKLLDTYRNIDKNNLILALKVKREGSYQPTNKNEINNLLLSEKEYLENFNKNLFKSDYDLKKENKQRDIPPEVEYGEAGSDLENISTDLNNYLEEESSPMLANIFPDAASRTRFLMNQLGESLNEYPQKIIGGITQFDNILRKIEYARAINNKKLDELRSKLNFGIINLADLLGNEMASHITICADCQAKIKNSIMDLLRKISNFLTGFPISGTEKEIKYYTIDYIDVEFYRDTKDYSKYDLVLPLTLENKETKILKEEIQKQLLKLEKK